MRFARTRGRVFDSLRDNAYGMYLIHYAFVSWLQLALLRAPLGGLTKGILAFRGTALLSWSAVAALRRIPSVARVIQAWQGGSGQECNLPGSVSIPAIHIVWNYKKINQLIGLPSGKLGSPRARLVTLSETNCAYAGPSR